MSATAARLGMRRTKFANANGLPAPEQVTTARDLGKLAMAVVHDYPQYGRLWSMQEARVGRRQFRTHNGLLVNYAGADGMKTGFICDSGFNVVASATRDGRKLIAVVLGERTKIERSLRAANLLEHGFQTLGWKALFAAQTLDTLPVAENAMGPVTFARGLSPGCVAPLGNRVLRGAGKKGEHLPPPRSAMRAGRRGRAAPWRMTS